MCKEPHVGMKENQRRTQTCRKGGRAAQARPPGCPTPLAMSLNPTRIRTMQVAAAQVPLPTLPMPANGLLAPLN
jgi:hypothetical protein